MELSEKDGFIFLRKYKKGILNPGICRTFVYKPVVIWMKRIIIGIL